MRSGRCWTCRWPCAPVAVISFSSSAPGRIQTGGLFVPKPTRDAMRHRLYFADLLCTRPAASPSVHRWR